MIFCCSCVVFCWACSSAARRVAVRPEVLGLLELAARAQCRSRCAPLWNRGRRVFVRANPCLVEHLAQTGRLIVDSRLDGLHALWRAVRFIAQFVALAASHQTADITTAASMLARIAKQDHLVLSPFESTRRSLASRSHWCRWRPKAPRGTTGQPGARDSHPPG